MRQYKRTIVKVKPQLGNPKFGQFGEIARIGPRGRCFRLRFYDITSPLRAARLERLAQAIQDKNKNA